MKYEKLYHSKGKAADGNKSTSPLLWAVGFVTLKYAYTVLAETVVC